MPQVTPGREDDFLSNVDGMYIRADLGDLSGHITARNMRQAECGHSGQAAADPQVEMIQGAGVNADQDFVVRGDAAR